MTNIKTRFFGLELNSPVIVASSGLTADAANVKEFADMGAGAIVLKSVFEEEIINEYNKVAQSKTSSHFDEFIDYFDYKIRDQVLGNYGKLINDAKKASSAPVVASINCISTGDWVQFASQVEDAGADAIELNLFVMPFDLNKTAADNNKFYMESVREVTSRVKIPVTIKISNYFSDLGGMCRDLAAEKIAGITLFNRFANPDIDIKEQKLIPGSALSSEHEHLLPLRWVGILSSRLVVDIAASTGIHNYEQMIKMLLAGANAVQVASVFYRKSPKEVKNFIKGLEDWMKNNNYKKIDDFKGKLSLDKATNPSFYERAQYLSNFGGYAK